MYVYAKGLCNAPDAEMAEAAQQVFNHLICTDDETETDASAQSA